MDTGESAAGMVWIHWTTSLQFLPAVHYWAGRDGGGTTDSKPDLLGRPGLTSLHLHLLYHLGCNTFT